MTTHEEKDPDHLHGQDIIDFATWLNGRKTIYHSIAHLPEKTHDELQKMLHHSQYIGYDGMKVV